MKNFFKFVEPKDNNHFEIKEPEPQFAPKYEKDGQIDTSLSKNIDAIKEFFHFPLSNDFKLRNFDITINSKKYNSIILFYDGLADSNAINLSILKPLMKNLNVESKSIIKKVEKDDIKDIILGTMLIQSQINITKDYKEIIDAVNHGECAILVDTLDIGFLCDVKKIPARSVGKSEIEMTIKGPSEGFIETLRTNTALIRK